MFLVELDHRNIGNEHKRTSEYIVDSDYESCSILCYSYSSSVRTLKMRKSLDGGFKLTIFLANLFHHPKNSPTNKSFDQMVKSSDAQNISCSGHI